MYRLIITGRCAGDDFGPVSQKILSLVGKGTPAVFVLSGGLTTLNEVVENIASYVDNWTVERDPESVRVPYGSRFKLLADGGGDYWLDFGGSGNAKYYANTRNIPYEVVDFGFIWR